MNLQEWGLFFCVIIVLFVLAPKLINYMFDESEVHKPKRYRVQEQQAKAPVDELIVYKRDKATGHVYNPKVREAELIGRAQTAGKADKCVQPDANMISTYYVNASTNVPTHFIRKPIGACPDSKPMSKALPVGNVPMCMAKTSGTMVLSAPI